MLYITHDTIEALPSKTQAKLLYTAKHRMALEYLLNYHSHSKADPAMQRFVNKDLRTRIADHDLDKCMLLILGCDPKQASAYHQQTQPHHVTTYEDPDPWGLGGYYPTKLDMAEAIFDYESAGLTKPDKPLNAYETIRRDVWDNTLAEDMLDICKSLGMGKTYNVNDKYDFHLPADDKAILTKLIADLNEYQEKHPDIAEKLEHVPHEMRPLPDLPDNKAVPSGRAFEI